MGIAPIHAFCPFHNNPSEVTKKYRMINLRQLKKVAIQATSALEIMINLFSQGMIW